MRDDDEHRLLLQMQRHEQIGDGVGGGAIEVAGRLVAEQQRGLADQRPRDRDALTLAAGQLRGPMIDALLEADGREQRAGALGRRRRDAAPCRPPSARGRSRAPRTAAAAGGPETRSRSCLPRNAACSRSPSAYGFVPLMRHGAGRRRLERAEDVEQRALAAPGRAR